MDLIRLQPTQPIFLLHAKCQMHSEDWSSLMIFRQKIDGALLALRRKRLRFSRVLTLSCPSCSGFIHSTGNRSYKHAPQFPLTPAHSEHLCRCGNETENSQEDQR